MKILCALSGLEFNCEHFPGTFYSKEIHHPIFNLPQKRLLSYTGKWAAGELTPTDSYLLFLALLNSSDKVEFRVPVFRNEQTNSIVANNMEYLLRTVIKLNTVNNPSVTFPSFVITTETRFLTNVHYWIENWEEVYKDFVKGVVRGWNDKQLVQREAALQRMIKNPHREIKDYASQLAHWAAAAGNFPDTATIPNPFTNAPSTLSDYWKTIIFRCSREEQLFSIPELDLKELIEHCEEYIPIGSIYSNALFKLLRRALERQKNFLGIDIHDVRETYKMLEDSIDTEEINLKKLIDTAPKEMPKREDYPNNFAFMRAKSKWDLAKRYSKKDNGEIIPNV